MAVASGGVSGRRGSLRPLLHGGGVSDEHTGEGGLSADWLDATVTLAGNDPAGASDAVTASAGKTAPVLPLTTGPPSKTAATLWAPRMVALWDLRRNTRALLGLTTVTAYAGRGSSTRDRDVATRAGALDGLRALAALWVLAQHCFVFLPVMVMSAEQYGTYVALLYHFATRVVLNGSFGPDMFFCISGYLILAILRREMRGTAPPALRVPHSS
jgi:hypothetical protein